MNNYLAKKRLSGPDLQKKQMKNIIFITFWSQFSVHALNSVLILFLTRPLCAQGLGYSQAKAYTFIGVAQATNYLMPILGGYMADTVVGIRRSILVGSSMLALAYLLLMLSGYTVSYAGDRFFIAAYALIPATNSLLMGTASSMVSHIYAEDAIKAKSAMTYYYIAINLGGLIASIIAPIFFEGHYGPLCILTLAFVGKAIAVLNFAKNYSIYDKVIWGKDHSKFLKPEVLRLIAYIAWIYLLTLFAYSHASIANILITLSCGLGIVWFLGKTLRLKDTARSKQLIAFMLILEAVVFFVIYNQMHSTLILFAKNNSNHHLFNFIILPAHYQMLNPLLILAIGSQMPRLYQKIPRFTIPYQFATGILLAGIALLVLFFSASKAIDGVVDGNYIALTYILLSIAELLVSAIGLSMIGLYCSPYSIAFSMGVWYLASSLAHTLSGRLAAWVAIPQSIHSALDRLPYYKNYYLALGLSALGLSLIMYLMAYFLQKIIRQRGISLT